MRKRKKERKKKKQNMQYYATPAVFQKERAFLCGGEGLGY
jgi:hypothetical protein